MTGNLLIDSAISLTGIALMVLVARLVFPAPSVRVSEAAARKRLALDEPDFEPREWLVDRDGAAALAAGANGEFALVTRLGLDLVVRRFRAGAVRAEAQDGALAIRFADPTLAKAVIAGGEAASWARKLVGDGDIKGA